MLGKEIKQHLTGSVKMNITYDRKKGETYCKKCLKKVIYVKDNKKRWEKGNHKDAVVSSCCEAQIGHRYL